jgi:hypothetical protein
MEFAVMVWSSGNARGSSIYGILDKATPGKLPMISEKGHWADTHKTIKESKFKDAAEAKKSIAEVGFYLAGGELTFTTIEGKPPPIP